VAAYDYAAASSFLATGLPTEFESRKLFTVNKTRPKFTTADLIIQMQKPNPSARGCISVFERHEATGSAGASPYPPFW
jgi:hypothetical protein